MDLEAMEHHSTSQFSLYVKKLRNKPASYGMQQFDLGKDPYCQNIPESVNFNRFLISLQDLVLFYSKLKKSLLGLDFLIRGE